MNTVRPPHIQIPRVRLILLLQGKQIGLDFRRSIPRQSEVIQHNDDWYIVQRVRYPAQTGEQLADDDLETVHLEVLKPMHWFDTPVPQEHQLETEKPRRRKRA